jgi:secondary thiamine-phosphate synthase enzyme
MLHKLDIKTTSRVEFRNVTGEVQQIVLQSGVISGLCYVYVPHTTAAVTVNENADPDVVRDIITHLDKLVPQHGDYRHSEGNSPAHIKSVLLGHTETIFIENRNLVLGAWEGIFFCEFDGPRNRKLYVKLVED